MSTTQSQTGISIACEADVPGIHALMMENLAARGGSLSASFSPEQIVAMLRAMPMVIARHEGEVIGFLMTSTCAGSQEVPILRAMLEAYPGRDDAYVYGPICVAAGRRGQGLAQAMFAELRRQLPGREGILFVRRDNAASLRAHARMNLQEVACFTFRDSEHAVFAYIG